MNNGKEYPPVNEAPEETSGGKIDENKGSAARNGYVNACNSRRDAIEAGVPSTGLAIVPVNVKCRDSAKIIQTYAFLDTGDQIRHFVRTSCWESLE